MALCNKACPSCSRDMHACDFHNTRDIFNRLRINLHWKCMIYLKPVIYTSCIVEIFILCHTFSTFVTMNTVHMLGSQSEYIDRPMILWPGSI